MIQNKIILCGTDNSHALGVVRQLANHDLDVLFLVDGKKHNCATKSKYCTEFRLTTGIKEALSYLLSTYKDEKAKAILV